MSSALETAIFTALANDTALAALLPGAVHLVTVTATGGSFTLTFNAQTTAVIAFGATAATVQTALLALSTVGTGNALVTGNAGGPFTVTFRGTLADTVLPLTGSAAGLTGPAPALTIVQRASVFNTVATRAPDSGYLVFSKISSIIERTIGSKISEEYRYQFSVNVKAPSVATINSAVVRLEALFDRQTLAISGSTFWLAEKIADNPNLAAELSGALWLSGGADFRFILGD